MRAVELKKYIAEDISRIVTVLEFYKCHSINFRDDEIRCSAPDGDNSTAVAVKTYDQLYAVYYSDSNPYQGDLIGLCQHFGKEKFKQTMVNLHALFGLSLNGEKVTINKKDSTVLIEKYVNKEKRRERFKDTDQGNKKYDESILNEFLPYPHEELFQEAVLPKVANKFHIGFDTRKNRITFPHYDWEDTDKIVGIQGRIVGMTSEEANMIGVPKYWNYIKGYKKSRNLYGWKFAKDNLSESGKLFIFESEKSVLKQFSFTNGKGYSVAVGGHEISDQQVAFIESNTSPECEIIIAFDKDIMKNEEYLKKCCRKFKYRRASYLYDWIDNGKILREKDSPIDHTYKVFKVLYEYRRGVNWYNKKLDELKNK